VIPEEVLRIAEDIREMRVRGASRIARAAVEALLLAAERYQGSDPGEFARYMRRVAEILVSTRPTAVTLPNAVNYVVSALRGARGSCEELRELVVGRCRSFLSYIDSALDRIAEIGSRVLSSGDVVLTHCNSLAAVKVIARAHERKGVVARLRDRDKAPLPGPRHLQDAEPSRCGGGADPRLSREAPDEGG